MKRILITDARGRALYNGRVGELPLVEAEVARQAEALYRYCPICPQRSAAVRETMRGRLLECLADGASWEALPPEVRRYVDFPEAHACRVYDE